MKPDPKLMQQQILKAMARRKVHISTYQGTEVKFGIVTDTHIGSIYETNELLVKAYEVFKRENIYDVFHAGDLCDGEKMYRGQEYEIYAHGSDSQVEAAVNRYPLVKGITTHFICGNHDLSFWKQSGNNIGKKIAALRSDMNYLGDDEADVLLKSDSGTAMLRLRHGGGGTAYAISYKIQQYINSLSGGHKPNILIQGHFHKAEYLPCYRHVFSIQGGCIQAQTPFMRAKHTAAHMGFWIVQAIFDGKLSIARLNANFFAHYA